MSMATLSHDLADRYNSNQQSINGIEMHASYPFLKCGNGAKMEP